MDEDKAIRAAKLTLGAVMDKRRAKTAKDRAGGQIAPSKYLPNVPRQVHADGGEVTPDAPPPVDLGQVREQKQMQTFHTGMMGDIRDRMTQAMEAHQKAVDAGHFDGYEVGDVLQGKNSPLKITGRYVQKWKPSAMTLQHFDRMGAKPTIIEHEGQQYIPMLRYTSGSEAGEDSQEGTLYLDAVKATGMRKMGGLRAVKARGGQVSFQAGNHPDVPEVLYHGNAPSVVESRKHHGDGNWTSEVDQEATDRNIAAQDFREFRPSQYGNYGPGIYLTDKPEVASDFAQGIRADQTEPKPHGQVLKLHVSMKRPFTEETLRSPRWKAYLMDTISGSEVYSSERPHRDALLQKLNDGTATVRDLFLHDTPDGTMVNQFGQNDIHAKIRNSGFDGIIAHRPDGSKEYVAFKPEQVKSALSAKTYDPTSPDMTFADGGYVPEKTQKAYKLFRTKGDGKLYPLFVHADKPVEMGKWLEAEEGPQGKTQGKVKSKLGDLAYRPGWHAGDLPIATHIGGKSDPSLKKPDYRPDNHVWAEVEMAADRDWQAEADSRGKGVKAHITDQVPLGGFYRYKTNPNMTGNWLIGGHMKVNRVLSDDEVKAINDQAGVADLPRLDRTQKADGGSVAERSPMFEGMHEDLLDDEGKPMDLWHGTPVEGGFEAFDDAKLGSTRDHGFYGRGHYLTPDQEGAAEYAGSHAEEGTLMGPLHAALKNPYIWDTSDSGAHRTLRDLQSMGIMKGQGKLEPWDNLQRHHIDPFMAEMKRRGHDGVLVKTNRGLSEVVVFNPNMIKHRDAEVGDPEDPRIMRAKGGKVDLYSKAARIVRGLKDNPMQSDDIIKYALGKGAKKSEIAYSNIPSGKLRPSEVAEYIELMQPQIGVRRKEAPDFRFGNDAGYDNEIQRLNRAGRFDEAEALNAEWERFAGYGGDEEPRYAQYQLGGKKSNYREHILTLENHEGPTYTAKLHWGRLENPLAHIRMSDRIVEHPADEVSKFYRLAMQASTARDAPTQLQDAVDKGVLTEPQAATVAKRLFLTSSPFYKKQGLDKKILHIEELQSDWNNDARRGGIRTGTEQQDYDRYVAQMRADAVAGIDPTVSPMIHTALRQKYESMDPYMLAMKLGRQSEHNDAFLATKRGVPKAPYIDPDREDASELALKHVLMEAAKGGYDGIAFTPDKAQSERWRGTNFDGIYDRKLPSMTQKLIRQHDPEGGSNDNPQNIDGWAAPHVELTDKARDSINQNGFSSFRRGGYVTHVRRAR